MIDEKRALQENTMQTEEKQKPKDEPEIGLNILSLLIPLAGLIIFLIYFRKAPIMAKSAAKFALIGFVILTGLRILLTQALGGMFLWM